MKKIARKILSMMLVFVMTFGIALPVSAGTTFNNVNLTFEESGDLNSFSDTDSWEITQVETNGVLKKKDTSWDANRLTQVLPMDEDLTISFDVYMAADNDTPYFAFGLMNEEVTHGTLGWFRQSEWGDLLTWGKDDTSGPTFSNFANDIGDQLAKDTFGHKRNIKIDFVAATDVMTISIDNEVKSFTNQQLGADALTCTLDEAYFTVWATNTTAYIDNLKITAAGEEADNKPELAQFSKVNINFENATHLNSFSDTGSWTISNAEGNGVLKKSVDNDWNANRLSQALPLDRNLTISFDMYIAEYSTYTHFGFGLMNEEVTHGTLGWFRDSVYGNLLTWGKDDVSGPTFSNFTNDIGDQLAKDTFGHKRNIKIDFVAATDVMTISIDNEVKSFTNQQLGADALTCTLDEAYFTVWATNTTAYIDNLKIIETGTADDYCEDFSDLSAFNKIQYYTSVNVETDKFVGSGSGGIDYKLPVENYRLDMTIKLNTTSGENRLCFNVPDIAATNVNNGGGGYILHFYQGHTWLYDNSITRSGWYDYPDGARISVFNNPANLQNDGQTHKLTLVSYEDKFYILIDGKFFTYGTENTSKVYEGANYVEPGYIRFLGSDWELSQFDITLFGGNTDVASAHFNGVYSVYETVENLDQTKYSTYSWNQVLKLRDDCFKAMDAIKDGTNVDAIATLASEAVAAITAVPEKTVVPEDVVGENQILIGYKVSGGTYGEGGLYNFKVGDELPEGEGIVLEPVVATMYMQAGASVRLKTDAGIRWKTIVNKQDYEKLTELNVAFGTRVTSVGSDKYIDIPLENGLNLGETAHSYVGAVTTIKESNYTRVYNGCGYATVTYEDGSTDMKFATNNDNERTYKYIVEKALSDVSLTEKDGYSNEIEKDGETVYSPYTDAQYDLLTSISTSIKNSETSVMGTGAQVHFLNISGGKEVDATGRPGNALSMLLRYNGKNVLIDAGDTETQYIVEGYLNNLGITTLDYVIATHAHEDHIGAMPYILEKFEVGTLIYREPDWDTINSATDKALNDAMVAAANGKNVTLVQPDIEGYQVSLGDNTYFEIYNCTNVYTNHVKNDLNYYSLQTYFVSGTAKAFLSSDSVGLYDNAGLLENIGKVDLYQAQHHGQGGEYSPKELVDALQPKATVAATNSGTFIKQCSAACDKYGKVYATGYTNHLVFEDTYGSFQLKGDAEDRWNSAQKVSITGSELTFESGKRQGTDGNTIVDDWVKPGNNSGTAFVLNVPENMNGTSVINVEVGKAFYIEGTTTEKRVRVVLNNRVIYDSNASGMDGDALDLTFTVSAGDKVYFIAEGTGGSFRMPLEMYIDGRYFCVGHLNHIDPANGGNAAATGEGAYNLFAGMSDKGTYYTREELLSYMSVVVTEIQ